MAKPDCDDGWYKKSIELEAALGYADFTKIAQTLLRFVFCQIFGQGIRPKYAVLNCSEIASRMKKPRQHIHRAIQELVASKALVPLKGREDTYRFVKDYEKWVSWGRTPSSCGHPRLTLTEVIDCLDAPDYSRGFILKKDTDESVINRDDTVAESNGTLSSIGVTNCHQSGLQTVIPIDDKSVPPYVPPIRKEIENRERESVRPSLNGGEIADADRLARNGHPTPDNHDLLVTDLPADSPIPEAAAPKLDKYERALRKFILERSTSAITPQGNDDFADFALQQFRMWRGQDYPVEVIKDAIKAATNSIGLVSAKPWSKWVTKCLAGYAADNASLPRAPARPQVREEDYYHAPEFSQFDPQPPKGPKP